MQVYLPPNQGLTAKSGLSANPVYAVTPLVVLCNEYLRNILLSGSLVALLSYLSEFCQFKLTQVVCVLSKKVSG